MLALRITCDFEATTCTGNDELLNRKAVSSSPVVEMLSCSPHTKMAARRRLSSLVSSWEYLQKTSGCSGVARQLERFGVVMENWS
jgi:hypothetical protein